MDYIYTVLHLGKTVKIQTQISMYTCHIHQLTSFPIEGGAGRKGGGMKYRGVGRGIKGNG